MKNCVLKNFAHFVGKHCVGVLFNKVAGLYSLFYADIHAEDKSYKNFGLKSKETMFFTFKVL